MSDDNRNDFLARFREAQDHSKKAQQNQERQAPEMAHIEPEAKVEFVKSKGFYRSYASTPVGESLAQSATDMTVGAEDLIGSTIHRYLYDRPPQELITSDKENPNLLYIKSDIPETASTLEGLGKQGKLKKIEGFERLVASCQVLGEQDYGPSDIVVQEQKDAAGKSHLIADKRSHGRSFESSISDFDTMVRDTAAKFEEFGYSEGIEKGHLSFNIDEYSKSLQEMTTKLSSKIDSVVESAVGELERVEFEPEFSAMSSSMQKAVAMESARGVEHDLDKLKITHQNLLTTNVENLKKISEKIDIIARFTDADVNKKFGQKFKKGGWLQEFAADSAATRKADLEMRRHITFSSVDPVDFACRNDIKIDGKNALQWAYENKYEIEPGKPFHQEYLRYDSLLAKPTPEQDAKNNPPKLTEYDKQFIESLVHYREDKFFYDQGQDVSRLSRSDREFIGQATKQGLKFDDTRSFADLGIKGLNSKKSLAKSLLADAQAVLGKGVKIMSGETLSPSSTPGHRPNAGKGTQR